MIVVSVGGVPLQPGQPGGEWSEEEVAAVRDKVLRLLDCSDKAGPTGWVPGSPECWRGTEMYNGTTWNLDDYTRDIDAYGPRANWDWWTQYFAKWSERRPTPARIIQLAFHDCLRYEDVDENGGGSGGCDGCLNWSGMGFKSAGMDFFTTEHAQYAATPVQLHTTNNKLQMTARSLELIYNSNAAVNWPPQSKVLLESLKESGKSRADLWQFAGNIALEKAINITNESGRQRGTHNSETNLCAQIGIKNCTMTLQRSIPFRTGRRDCIPDAKSKWTHFDFEATRKERHSNSYGTGEQAIMDLKRDFNLTARESIALFALHGMSVMGRNPEEAVKYKWSGGSVDQNNMKTTFSNMYHKILYGKSYQRGRLQLFDYFPGYFLGDANGNPVGKSSFFFGCHMYWNTTGRKAGGPCHFVPTTAGCYQPGGNSDLKLRYGCFKQESDGSFTNTNGWGCETATLIDRDGFKIQVGGPEAPSECWHGGWQFLMPFEAGLIMDFQVNKTTNIPTGCGPFDGSWTADKDKTDGAFHVGTSYENAKPCQLVSYAPEGEALPEIVELFADDHQAWQTQFFNGWEKIQRNGYEETELKEGPANGQLMAPFMIN